MKITTSWLTPPSTASGLDHLGTQAPCVLIYSRLLPGITNVTDRARYFSFYPWVVWAYDQRYAKDDLEHFIDRFRRADCLFTLIAERHSRLAGANARHGAAMVGRNSLVPALDGLEEGGALLLVDYASLNDASHRYFKNRLGGLGQYYAGVLFELGLMQVSPGGWSLYTNANGPLSGQGISGEHLAQSLDARIDGDRFWKVVEQGVVSFDDLDALAGFCACNIVGNANECELLRDIFFDRQGQFDDGVPRRRTLGLIQHLAASLPPGVDLDQRVFRACVYTGALPGEAIWQVPESLQEMRRLWATYVRNDLLSVGFLTLFAVCLKALEPQSVEEGQRLSTIEAFAEWMADSSDVQSAVSELGGGTFGERVSHFRSSEVVLEAWEHPEHEVRLGAGLLAGWSQGEESRVLLRDTLRLLVALASRTSDQAPYSGFGFGQDALRDYPINLASFVDRVTQWEHMALKDVVADLVRWALNTHLRVALRKLRQTNRATFQLRPSERGLEVVADTPPAPTATSPRFRQAVQILLDLGVFTRDGDGLTRNTSDGRSLMEFACG